MLGNKKGLDHFCCPKRRLVKFEIQLMFFLSKRFDMVNGMYQQLLLSLQICAVTTMNIDIRCA